MIEGSEVGMVNILGQVTDLERAATKNTYTVHHTLGRNCPKKISWWDL